MHYAFSLLRAQVRPLFLTRLVFPRLTRNRVCDLRHVTRSVDMLITLFEHLVEAYNDGKIQPSGTLTNCEVPFSSLIISVFVFPPRSTKGTGPMFWNSQLLSFAGVSILPFSVIVIESDAYQSTRKRIAQSLAIRATFS